MLMGCHEQVRNPVGEAAAGVAFQSGTVTWLTFSTRAV
jgi:hypothetical protein